MRWLFVTSVFYFATCHKWHEFCLTQKVIKAVGDCSKNDENSCRAVMSLPKSNVTTWGVPCAVWSAVDDKKKEYKDAVKKVTRSLDHNRCTTTNGNSRPWCYIDEKTTVWDYCFVACDTKYHMCMIRKEEKECIATVPVCNSKPILPLDLKNLTKVPFCNEIKKCDPPATPYGIIYDVINETGGYRDNKYPLGTTLQLGCGFGYWDTNMVSQYMKCGTNGQWNDTRKLNCKPPCQMLRLPYKTKKTDVATRTLHASGSLIKVECEDGSWDGRGVSQTLKCLSNGEWNSTVKLLCNETYCKKPRIISERVKLWPNTSKNPKGAIIKVACENKFWDVLGTDQTIACLHSEKWNDTVITCPNKYCQIPRLSKNIIRPDKLRYIQGEVIDIQCKHQFWDENGSKQPMKCESNGVWNTTTAIRCNKQFCEMPEISETAIGSPLRQRYREAETIDIQCKEKYWDNDGGFQRMACQSDGAWNETVWMTCKNQFCFLPHLPQSVVVEAPKPKYHNGEILKIKCNDQYWDNHREAQITGCHDGKWNETVKIGCPNKYCKMPEVPKNALAESQKYRYISGDEVMIKCKESFSDPQNENTKAVCMNGGVWDTSADLNCTESKKQCQRPNIRNSVLQNGTRKNLYDLGEKIVTKCVGKNIFDMAPNSKGLVCRLNETTDSTYWDGQFPKCEVRCRKLPKVIGGTAVFTPQSDEPFLKPGTKANFRCLSAYLFSSDLHSTVFCDAAGEWSADVRNPCTRKCLVPEAFRNSELIHKPHKIEFRCNVGYQLIGDQTITCDENGNLKEKLPNCIEKCEPPPEKSHLGSRLPVASQYFKINDTVQYFCDANAEPAGSSDMLATCQFLGNGNKAKWSNIPECLEKKPQASTSITKKSPAWAVNVIIVLALLLLVSIGIACFFGLKFTKARRHGKDVVDKKKKAKRDCSLKDTEEPSTIKDINPSQRVEDSSKSEFLSITGLKRGPMSTLSEQSEKVKTISISKYPLEM